MPSDTTPKSDKKNLPSRHTTVGPERAPHRAFLYAMGVTEEEVYQPLVGVATTWNEAAPCNITLSRQAQMVKQGVRAAGGTPREFTTITVTDGIAMGHAGMKSSLVSREIIADSVELTMRGHCYDAIVGLAGCDKSLPGLMMAMVRLNVPAVFMYGGSILPGRFQNKDVTAAPAAASSPPTPWPACPRPSAWRCRARPARRRPTNPATSTPRSRAKRSCNC
jgi:dihydroxy-acid dehydratase